MDTGLPVEIRSDTSDAYENRRLPAALEQSLERSHLPALDALRAISAFLVVFYHIGSPMIPGGLGVLAFFVLSGFLITWLLLKEDKRSGTIKLRRFYVRRCLRIFPAFYVYWGIVVGGLWLTGRRLVGAQAIASFFYVNNYYQAIWGDPNTALSHTWSLGIEEQFYLLWPSVFLLLRKDRVRVLRVMMVVVAIVWVWRFFLKYKLRVWQGYFYEAFDTRMDGLAVGCALAIALQSGKGTAVWRRVTGAAWKSWVTLVLLAVSYLLELCYGDAYRDVFGLLVNPILVAVLIVQWMPLSIKDKGWRWLNHPWVVYLGTISYSVYLYQQLIPGIVEKVVRGMPGPVRLLAETCAILVVASLSYFVVERPFLRLKDRLPKEKGEKEDEGPMAIGSQVVTRNHKV